MVTASLVNEVIHEGERLLREADAAGLEVKAAFWLIESETGRPYLCLASPLVLSKGSQWFLLRLREILRESPHEITLDHIWDTSPGDKLIRELRKRVKPEESSGKRLHYVRLGDLWVDDVYIYRLA